MGVAGLQEARDKMRAACRLAAEILQMAGGLVKVGPGPMRFGSTATVLAKRMIEYYRISEWSARVAITTLSGQTML